LLKVNFISQAWVKLASHRLRVQKPVELINRKTEGVIATVTRQALNDVDVNVFFKHFDRMGNLQAASSAEDFGYRTVFDICDDHFDRAEGDYYTEMCDRVDAITCNSKNMQERIYEVTGRLATVINDPVTFPRRVPTIEDFKEFSFLWFGHSTNAYPLLKWLQHIPAKVTTICEKLLSHSRINYVPWGIGVVENAISDFNIVVIPINKKEHCKCKSMNRALDALNSGCVVITDDEEVYKDIADFVYTIKDPKEILGILKNIGENPLEAVEKITKAQAFIDEHYNDQFILDSWLDVFQNIGVIASYDKD
jgi:hypothetical protein